MPDLTTEQIITQYEPLVAKIARKYYASNIPLEDLIQEGNSGLLHAIRNYDETKKTKFITYATHCIAGKVRHYLRDHSKVINEPAWIQEAAHRIKKSEYQLSVTLGRAPTTEEIAKHTDLKAKNIETVRNTRHVFDTSVIDENTKGINIEPSFELAVDNRIVLEQAIGGLTPLEQEAIKFHYFGNYSQTEIAGILGVNDNRVRILLRSGLEKLKVELSGTMY